MNANELTVSRELAQELDKRGVRFRSYFYWTDFGDSDGTELYSVERFEPDDEDIEAPTAGELMAVLPDYIELSRRNEDGSAWWCSVEGALLEFTTQPTCWTWADTAPDACAKMLIWLIDNGHLTVNEKGEVV